MITINDIAKKAGVSKSTVSRYLNNGSVSDKTKEKIEEIIIETGYKPNTFARSLKAKKTNMIGVIIPRLNSASSNKVLEGIDSTMRKKGYQLIITNSNQNDERELENIKTLQRQKVEGIIMLTRSVTEKHIKLIKNLEIPFLSIGQDMPDIYSIVHQDYDAGQKIAKHAVELGHKKILYVGVSERDQSVGIERKRGFLDYINQYKEIEVEVIETEFSREVAYNQALTILPKLKATYIACATDNIGIAFLKALDELGYSVPEDFSISGFGGYSDTDFVIPSLTTVNFPYYKLGEEAVLSLLQLIKQEKILYLQTLPNYLEIKKSTQQI